MKFYLGKWSLEIVFETRSYGIGLKSKQQSYWFMLWTTYQHKFEPYNGKIYFKI